MTGVIHYVTREVDEARVALAAYYDDLCLDVVGPRSDFLTSVDVIKIGALTVGLTGFGTEIVASWVDPEVYHVCVPFSGRYTVQEGRADVLYATEHQAVVFDPERGVRVDDWASDSCSLSVKIDKLAVVRQLEILLGRPAPRRLRFDPYLHVGQGAGRSWASLVRWSLLELDAGHGLLQQPIIAGRLEQTLLEGLLLAAGHQYREALEAPPPPMRPSAVKRVMDAVQERPAEPYDAARLAEIAQVSLRTLQEAFRANVGMSPMGYVQEVRLQRVRQELRVSAPGSVTVTDVAFQWGFAHLGRFAQRYRARFGESPSQTLRSARDGAAAVLPALCG
jgi:AraC-like DNA-binding protein